MSVNPVVIQRYGELKQHIEGDRNDRAPEAGIITDGQILLKSTGSEGIVFNTAAGGIKIEDQDTIAQLTSTVTGVEINAIQGVITTVAANTAAETLAEFTVTNSRVAVGDYVQVSILDFSGAATGSAGIPYVIVTDVAAGSFKLAAGNISASNAFSSGTMSILFTVWKAT